MRGDARTVGVWALLNAGLAAGLLAYTDDPLQLGLFFGAAAAIAALGLLVAVMGRRGDERLLPDTSYSTVLLAIGVTTILIGTTFGLWLVLIGGGLSFLAAGGLVRELRAQHRARR